MQARCVHGCYGREVIYIFSRGERLGLQDVCMGRVKEERCDIFSRGGG